MLFILVFVLLLVAYGIAEYALHRRNLLAIPIRVQVNGTRGKSSVTRLIAAGLRAGGMRVAAKVTGTKPRFITGDAEEHPVRRLGKASILEELRMVRLARRHKAQALVIECMALVPEYQRTENLMLIRPTHGVITNVRADHLDVMGPTVARVAFALSNTIPRNGRFFTAERGPHLESLCRSPFANRHSPVVVADPTTVTDEEMAGFTYVEHKENVALALAVCDSLAVDRGQALAGMHRSLPDSGAMRITRIADSGKTFELVNTLAANDPDSIAMLWQMVMLRKTERIVLVNCRRDRQERSKQLAGLIAGWDCAHIVATGGLPRIFVRRAVSMGVPEAKLTLMDDECPPADVYARVLNLVATDALLFATGNTVGYGSDLMAHFEAKARVSGH